jgi:hypothetical protein
MASKEGGVRTSFTSVVTRDVSSLHRVVELFLYRYSQRQPSADLSYKAHSFSSRHFPDPHARVSAGTDDGVLIQPSHTGDPSRMSVLSSQVDENKTIFAILFFETLGLTLTASFLSVF